MNGTRQSAVTFCLVLIAAVFQGQIAHSVQIFGARPDLILIVLGCSASLTGAASGVKLGLWAGMLSAALVPGSFGSYLASRTISGALAGWLESSLIRDSLLAPPLVVFVTTLTAEAVFVVMSPTHHVRPWLQSLLGEFIYNTVLSIPIYFALRSVNIGHKREDSFSGFS